MWNQTPRGNQLKVDQGLKNMSDNMSDSYSVTKLRVERFKSLMKSSKLITILSKKFEKFTCRFGSRLDCVTASRYNCLSRGENGKIPLLKPKLEIIYKWGSLGKDLQVKLRTFRFTLKFSVTIRKSYLVCWQGAALISGGKNAIEGIFFVYILKLYFYIFFRKLIKKTMYKMLWYY